MRKLIDIQERHQLITEELAQDETIELINKTIAGYCEGSIFDVELQYWSIEPYYSSTEEGLRIPIISLIDDKPYFLILLGKMSDKDVVEATRKVMWKIYFSTY